MKYKNNTNKPMFFNVGGRWVDIQPGATIEIKGREQEFKGLIAVDSIEYFNKKKLKNLTKDELNDYAVTIGFPEIKTSVNKKQMINEILRLQNEK